MLLWAHLAGPGCPEWRWYLSLLPFSSLSSPIIISSLLPFFIILSGKLILFFHSWVHWICVFSSYWTLSIPKFLFDISCFPSSKFSPFFIIRQLLACCFFFLPPFFFPGRALFWEAENNQCLKHQRGSLLGHCVVHILSILAVNTSLHTTLLNSDLLSAALWKSLWNLVVFLAWQRAINLGQCERTLKKKLAMKI